ncbi:hypothetical protein ROP_pROB02-01860 (plasmid) [Rhodococcus opacus B4]|uniref:Uncharacterized protein n=1 Tax=Rhodococcus opacus (strain B4) TaxID=632772 RepID=C1BDZ0_RHOOB|nr:hypothetical protein ROP_pROB02-01860 [Rhodococcus opacus B4]
MTLRLPTTLATDSDAAAIEALTKYYDRPYLGDDAYVGAHFDSWSSTGNRAGEADRFTADDLVAVTFLSVQVPPKAARTILDTQSEALNAFLTAIGPDRDLVRRTGTADPGMARLGPGNGPVGAAGDWTKEGDEVDRPQTSPAVSDLGLTEKSASSRVSSPWNGRIGIRPLMH